MAQDRPANAPPQEETPSGAPRPKWTIMIYLAGDNNLSANSIDILRDLEDAFPEGQPNDQIRVVACFDPNTPRPRGARYVEINHRRHNGRKGRHPIPHWGLHNDLVPGGEAGDSSISAPDFSEGDIFKVKIPAQAIPEVGLSRFIKYTLKHHQADGYLLILFGHGSAVAGNTFLADNNPPSFLRLNDFAEVLREHFSVTGEGQKPALDILACDNCMMNGIETAYQIKDSVKYVLGSQGLMLAVGWQFRKIIERIKLKNQDTREVVNAICESCARSLLDFALMDRSSDQSLLDLTTFSRENNIVTAVRQLSKALQDGLEYKETDGKVKFPAIRDAVKLARLDAQSYFDETFVDLYDFCLLLLRKCNDALTQPIKISLEVLGLSDPTTPEEEKQQEPLRQGKKEELLRSDVMQKFQAIATACEQVLKEIKFLDEQQNLQGNFVLSSYYIGPDLQYSNGVSIYFPWTMPDGPTIFDPVDEVARRGSAATVNRPAGASRSYELRTPFDEYTKYAFAGKDGGDWTAFLVAFFRATLRNVRRSDYSYDKDTEAKGFFKITDMTGLRFSDAERDAAPAIDLHKSSSDMGYTFGGGSGEGSSSRIKNYPRRFYLSPADSRRRCPLPGRPPKPGEREMTDQDLPCVSYLGWNLRGLAATQVGIAPNQDPDLNLNPSGPASDNGQQPAPEVEPGAKPPESPSGAAGAAVVEDK